MQPKVNKFYDCKNKKLANQNNNENILVLYFYTLICIYIIFILLEINVFK